MKAVAISIASSVLLLAMLIISVNTCRSEKRGRIVATSTVTELTAEKGNLLARNSREQHTSDSLALLLSEARRYGGAGLDGLNQAIARAVARVGTMPAREQQATIARAISVPTPQYQSGPITVDSAVVGKVAELAVSSVLYKNQRDSLSIANSVGLLAELSQKQRELTLKGELLDLSAETGGSWLNRRKRMQKRLRELARGF